MVWEDGGGNPASYPIIQPSNAQAMPCKTFAHGRAIRFAMDRARDERGTAATAVGVAPARLAEIATLVNDIQECELNGKKSFDFFCAGEGENCDCPDGDIVWGPRFHAANPEAENSFADVIAGKKFIVKEANVRLI